MNEIRKIVEGKIYKLYNLFFWGFYFLKDILTINSLIQNKKLPIIYNIISNFLYAIFH